MSALRRELFRTDRPGFYEVGLLVLLANCVRDALAFYGDVTIDGPGFAYVSLNPVGWVFWMPAAWILDPIVAKAVWATVAVSAVCWAFKKLLPWSALVCATSYGLGISLYLSRMANYKHEDLPAVFALCVFAAFYSFRHREIARATDSRTLWRTNIYPRWVFYLMIMYMGMYYNYGGLVKLIAFHDEWWKIGTTLQLLVWSAADLPMASRILVSHHEIAVALMVGSIVLEATALPGLLLRKTRPWWALGLIGLHLGVLVTLGINFKLAMFVLGWLALPWQRTASWVHRMVVGKVTGILGVLGQRKQLTFLGDLVYAVDVLSGLRPHAVDAFGDSRGS